MDTVNQLPYSTFGKFASVGGAVGSLHLPSV